MNEKGKEIDLKGLGDLSSKEKISSGSSKRITLAVEKESKPISTWQFIIFAALLLIIFLAVLFVPKILRNTELNKNKYNNFDFYKGADGYWYTIVQKGNQPYQIPFYYHPRELEDITVEPGLRDKFFAIRDNNGSIFITLDPDSSDNKIVIAGVEIAKITGKGYSLLNVPTRSAFTKEPTNTTTNVETPIVTCDYASNKTMVIWLVISNKNIVYSYDNCIRLEAKSYDDMIRVADRLMYHLLGIMS
jgi:hypothetical protein